jgi:hypothetical protein
MMATSTPPTSPAAPPASPKGKPPPKADPPRCDLLGCGHFAVTCTDGTEVDAQGSDRKAIPNLNLCERHFNWAHSEDARQFANTSDIYKNRK